MPKSLPRYIHASEIGSYVFCHRSWQVGRQNQPSLLGKTRIAGSEFHQRHSEVTQAAPQARIKARRLAVMALILIALLLLWWGIR
jgi:hypothetical protein